MRANVPSALQPETIVQMVHARMPDLMALYAFGSRIQGTPRPDSDLDLAVLVAGRADPLVLWELAQDLAGITGCPIDLLDMRAASTVMQYQILSTDQRWYTIGLDADLFETMVLREKLDLDQARAGLLHDIGLRGQVYG